MKSMIRRQGQVMIVTTAKMSVNRRYFRQVLLLSLLCLTSAIALKAQETATQQTNPASLKWFQVNTPNFRILYPKGFEEQAQRMANTLELVREPEAASMGVKPKKISIILQNQSAVSNGFVTLAPRRVEFFAMPSQDYNFLGNNDWLNLLASHEYRHVVQYQRSITGFDKLVYYLLGQQALSGLANAAAPYWFWEGDAVATETAFTRSGRGRIPNFNLLLRTNFLEGRTFNYHKQYLRSYKNNIPDHYVLGYHMVSYLRKKTGDAAIWEKIVKRAWDVPFIPFTFSNAIKKETGLYVKDLYNEMAASLTARWKKELEDLPITSFETVNKRTSKAYTDYKFPQQLEDGSIVVQKSGIGDIEQLIVIKDGKEEKRYVQGQINSSGMMSAAGSSVVWNEFRFDPRWLVRTYSVIKRYDFKIRKATVISTDTRYASAALSPDGSRIVTVETGTDYQTRLVILHGQNGKVLKEFANPENNFYSMPRWTEDGKSIIALNTSKEGKTITRVDVESGTTENLFPPGDENVGYPVPWGKYILYNSPYSGIDNIYALDTSTGKRYQLTCSKYGAYNPAVSMDGKTIYYNDQTRNGFDVVKIPFDISVWKPLEEVRIQESTFYQHLVDQEGHPGLLDHAPSKSYGVKRYHRANGMINPHSWGTYFTNTYAQAQFGIYSQDILSTTSINAGYQFDINERTGSWQAGISYQGFYPIIDFQILTGDRIQKNTVYTYSLNSAPSPVNVKFNWKETTATLGLRLPLTLTRSKYFSQLEFGNYLGLTKVTSFSNTITQNGVSSDLGNRRFVPIQIIPVSGTPAQVYYLFSDQVSNGNLLSNYFYINYIHALKESRRDFNPKFGQYLYFEHYSTPYGGDFYGRLWMARGLAYFPGLLKHHSLFFRGGYQNSLSSYNLNTYTFRNRVFKPRGYSYPADNEFTSFSSNYQFPIWYPDIAAGPILNVQRIKANLFYDYGTGSGRNYYYDFANNRLYTQNLSAVKYLSTGVELTFDVNIMRLLQQVEVGFRVTNTKANAYNKGGLVYEFLLGNIPL